MEKTMCVAKAMYDMFVSKKANNTLEAYIRDEDKAWAEDLDGETRVYRFQELIPKCSAIVIVKRKSINKVIIRAKAAGRATIVGTIHHKMHKNVYLDYDKICNMQLTQPVNCHIIIVERSPLTLWS